MKIRAVAVAAAIACAALAACGGGGGGVGPPNPPPSSTPKPTPTPYQNGATFAYTGSQTSQASFQYPSPSPYPSTNVTTSVTQAVNVTSSANPFGAPSAGDFHTVETDAAALTTHTLTTDAWIGTDASGHVVEYGYKNADDSGNALSAQYPTPFILDELPETGGATWQNGGAVTYKENDADGTSSVRTYNANGTYTETTTSSLAQLQLSQNADGSGSYTSNGAFLNGAVEGFAFSAPANNQVNITVTFVNPPTPTPAPSGHPSPVPVPTSTPRVYTAPVWWPTPLALYKSSTSVTANVAYPASCSVPSAEGTSGNELVQTTSRVDTILGYTDVQTQTTYTGANAGVVCLILQDVQNSYYDYQDDFAAANSFHLHFPGTPLSTATVSETLTLTGGHPSAASANGRRTSSSTVQSRTLSAGYIAAAQAQFARRTALDRHARELHALKFLRSLGHRGDRS